MFESVIVTGASKGIGACIVDELASKERSKNFILVARKSEYFENYFNELKSKFDGLNFVKIYGDLGVASDVDHVLSQISKSGFEISGVVNNAGYTNPKSIPQIDVDDFEYTLRTNLIAPFRLVQFLNREFGHKLKFVLNVASTAGITGRAGWLSYSASKAAVINMSDVMREELRVYGTRVICISPGRCATDLRKTLAPEEDPTTIMQPQDVAAVVDTLLAGVGQMIDSHNIVVRR